MRYEHVDLIGPDPRRVERPPTDVAHLKCRPTEHRGTFETHERAWAAWVLRESDPVDVLAYGVGPLAFATRDGRSNALNWCLAHHHRRRAVGEDEAVATVAHVYCRGQFFCADHQHLGGASAPGHVCSPAKRAS